MQIKKAYVTNRAKINQIVRICGSHLRLQSLVLAAFICAHPGPQLRLTHNCCQQLFAYKIS